MSKETAQNPQPLLDRPDRKLLLVGRGGGLGERIGREALELSGLERPKNVLIIPSAANNAKAYRRYTEEPNEVFRSLGAKVKVLHGNPNSKTFEDPSAERIANMVGEADVIWMSGGNTTQARNLFDRTGLGQALVDSEGKVISGGSAGTLLQANEGISWYTPEGKPEENQWVIERGMGMFKPIVGVHHDYIENEPWNGGMLDTPRSIHHEAYLEERLTQPGSHDLGVGIDDASALAISDGTFRVVNAEDASPGVGVTSYRRRDSGLIEARFNPQTTQNYLPLDQLRPTA
ncbi:MAG TPA: Type 1 glutamine amidotransferase-like domain-containing protein [Candidatus Saccharibacteria bacterium]|jgi:hypothetical protein|nr:Type 1 glutamine amidotransferase-like domain-containing protein [Candidatus Saccharibacteria bacterium]